MGTVQQNILNIKVKKNKMFDKEKYYFDKIIQN